MARDNKDKKRNKNFRRNYSKDQRRDIEIKDTAEAAEKSKSNPPTWYDHYPTYASQAGTVPFASPLGRVIQLYKQSSSSFGGKFTIPGIMAIHFGATPGASASNDSPINRAAQRVYTYMRGKQKTSKDYDAADILISFMALDSCYSYHSCLRRIYGVYNSYTPTNRYYARTLLQALGVDPDDLATNGAQLCQFINQFAISLGSFTAPKSMDIIARHRWMCEGLYVDGESEHAQTYVFVPEGFWQYDNTVSTGSELKWVKFFPSQGDAYTTLKTVADLINFGKNLYANLLGDEDISDISGDFYNALGPSECIQLTETPLEYQVTPLYDTVVLSQIENCSLLGAWADSTVISQNPTVNNGAIIFQPQFVTSNDLLHYLEEDRLVNYHGTQPDPLMVIEMTKLTVATDVALGTGSGVQYVPTAFGSEIAFYAYVFRKPYDQQQDSSIAGPAMYSFVSAIEFDDTFGLETMAGYLRRLTDLAAFDWAPQLNVYYLPTGEDQSIQRIGDSLDYESIAVLDSDKLDMIHDVAMNSLFYLPQMGFTNQ